MKNTRSHTFIFSVLVTDIACTYRHNFYFYAAYISIVSKTGTVWQLWCRTLCSRTCSLSCPSNVTCDEKFVLYTFSEFSKESHIFLYMCFISETAQQVFIKFILRLQTKLCQINLVLILFFVWYILSLIICLYEHMILQTRGSWARKGVMRKLSLKLIHLFII